MLCSLPKFASIERVPDLSAVCFSIIPVMEIVVVNHAEPQSLRGTNITGSHGNYSPGDAMDPSS